MSCRHLFGGVWIALVLALALTSTRLEASDDINLSIDARLGFEALEEPLRDQDEFATENNGYVTVNAAALMQFFNLQAYFQAPLRFNTSDFTLRAQDWDEPQEFLRAIRCARIDYMHRNGSSLRLDERGGCHSWTPDEAAGAISQPRSAFTYLSMRLHPVYRYSLGYGSIVSGYSAMLEEDHYREGLTLDMNFNRTLVVSAALSDVVNPSLAAGRLAWRPMQSYQLDGHGAKGNFGETDIFMEIGLTAATDLRAPVGNDLLQTNTSSEMVTIGGVDARFRYTSQDTSSMERYRVVRIEIGSEFNQILDYAGASHNHLRFYYDRGWVDFFVDGEYRLLLGQYIPSYFDQHYRVQRTQFNLSSTQRDAATTEAGLAMTKLDFLGALPDEIHHAYAASGRFRFWSEISHGSGWDRAADLWFFVEQVPARDNSGRAGVGLALFGIDDKLDVWAQFIQQGWNDVASIFDLSGSVLEVNARYILSESLYLNFFFDQTWFLIPGTSDAFDTTNHLGLSLGFFNEL